MGTVMDKRATTAWREAGESWEVDSSRLIVVRLSWGSKKQRKHGGSTKPWTCSYLWYVPMHQLLKLLLRKI